MNPVEQQSTWIEAKIIHAPGRHVKLFLLLPHRGYVQWEEFACRLPLAKLRPISLIKRKSKTERPEIHFLLLKDFIRNFPKLFVLQRYI